MTSNSHSDGPLPDTPEAQKVTLPFTPNPSPTDIVGSSSHDDAVPEKSWKPTFDRRQSWSDQDRKHQLQERLLGCEKGKEMGFTEAHGI